jgi:hypothetical protein
MELNPKFKEIPTKAFDDSVIRSYQHIDNGGHTVEIDRYGNLTIETSFFGYSQTTVMLSTIDIDGLIDFLQVAKQRLAELETVRKLKGE